MMIIVLMTIMNNTTANNNNNNDDDGDDDSPGRFQLCCHDKMKIKTYKLEKRLNYRIRLS